MQTQTIICRVPECSQFVRYPRFVLCGGHYQRLKRFGDIQVSKPIRTPNRTPFERFWSKVSKGPDCWVWTGARLRSGDYGALSFGGQAVRAHVLSFWIHGGVLLPGTFVCHHCDNPPCVRPEHLYAGTAKTNAHDMIRRGRAGPQVGRVREWAYGSKGRSA